jgi:hypothetical protein
LKPLCEKYPADKRTARNTGFCVRRGCTLPIQSNHEKLEKVLFSTFKSCNMRKSKISNTQRLEILAKWDSGISIDELFFSTVSGSGSWG